MHSTSQTSVSAIPGLSAAQAARCMAAMSLVNTFSQLATVRSSYGNETGDPLSPRERRLYDSALDEVNNYVSGENGAIVQEEE